MIERSTEEARVLSAVSEQEAEVLKGTRGASSHDHMLGLEPLSRMEVSIHECCHSFSESRTTAAAIAVGQMVRFQFELYAAISVAVRCPRSFAHGPQPHKPPFTLPITRWRWTRPTELLMKSVSSSCIRD